MSKKDISSLITKGSAKQRANLYFNARANESSGLGEILTKKEADNLIASFKTSAEIKLYHNFVSYDQNVRNTLSMLGVFYSGHKEQIAYISAYGFLWDSYQRSVGLINRMLSIVDNKKTRDKLLELLASEKHYYFLAALDIDKEGFLDLNTKDPDSVNKMPLELYLYRFKIAAISSIGQIKGTIKALRDFMRETGFNIKLYKEIIKTIEEELKEDKAIYPKFSKAMSEENNIKVDSKYFIYPMYEDVDIDEETYNDIKKRYLGL